MSAWLPAPDHDGTRAGELEPCPSCLAPVAFGGGVTKGWHRLHSWCIEHGHVAESETRLGNGAMV